MWYLGRDLVVVWSGTLEFTIFSSATTIPRSTAQTEPHSKARMCSVAFEMLLMSWL